MQKSDTLATRYFHKKAAEMYPVSLTDWETHIKTLTGENLFSKTVAANTQAFADKLREEGFTMGDFQKILQLFVQQCQTLDVRIPVGGALDLVALLKTESL